ncbi:hypothetical protein DB41_IJ00160 [Neochlamydia sp. TUME1]|nr:hypothetical protein DB41_IJ00160 [Neochlamydia sp. TUME1]
MQEYLTEDKHSYRLKNFTSYVLKNDQLSAIDNIKSFSYTH